MTGADVNRFIVKKLKESALKLLATLLQINYLFNLKKVFTIHLTPSLPGSILCVCACVAGLSYFTVTTDPIKLWSSTSSVARQQKEYFDKHFSPFFRPTQVLRNN